MGRTHDTKPLPSVWRILFDPAADVPAWSSHRASLWTSQGNSSGGPIAVQRHNPRTGAVFAAASGPRPASAPRRSRPRETTPGSRTRLACLAATSRPASLPVVQGPLHETRPERSPAGREVFTNGVKVYLTGQGIGGFGVAGDAAVGMGLLEEGVARPDAAVTF